jgi:hypothetical protein
MAGHLWQGHGKRMIPLPRSLMKRHVEDGAKKTAERLAFMTEDHHRVRDFVVLEIPRAGAPLSPGFIAGALDLPLDYLSDILDELESNMTFLFRNPKGEVAWAYPVTADPTPHHVTFSTGESIFAA